MEKNQIQIQIHTLKSYVFMIIRFIDSDLKHR